ncbi:urease accessory protein UreF [Nonomuraea typhae]|uniref:urease accessory protein UreF n=1 Tax=Nonomuraea typhae TaxID=2603600 RepID=UPI0012F8A5E0|nr:urease accessory UreF family protein [Nonomuraea typhae]
MHPALLLLADSRLPAGGHAHSGGAEAAIASGHVTGLPSLAAFLRGRLHTTGRVSAALAATACTLAQRSGPSAPWRDLQAEADARTTSPALRRASCRQGKLLLHVARRLWPGLDALAAAVPEPHHPLALGAAAHAAGAAPGDAALAAAYHSVTGPATAAVRLLGLDPVEVHRLLAGLTGDLARIAGQAHGSPESLPACSAPALDLLAEQHARADLRLFVS